MIGSCCYEDVEPEWKSYDSPDGDKRLPRVHSHYPKTKINLEQADEK